jgi:predicted AlkP superfamily pyrophosphatase or phosphodiesterase
VKKLVLAVIDSLKPELLDRAIDSGRAPALKALVEHGTYIRDCVSSFPSVTPVASASIATGLGPDRHHIPAMNWYHRGEERYVEYGSSFAATRTFGIVRSLYDTVYNMNLAHLNRNERTVYEIVEDAGLRAAATTYLIYRGRHRHPADEAGPYTRIAKAAQFRHAVWGPTELFYADLFASQKTDCRSTLGMPGQRDRHSGCVAAHMVENDLFDFMLLSLPDNDTHSHRYGPYAQASSIVEADRAIERMMHAAGGIDAFLEEHAMIVMSDHSQVPVERSVNLAAELDNRHVLAPDGLLDDAEIAVCPSARSAMVYVLDDDGRAPLVRDVASDLCRVEGVDLVANASDGEVVVRSAAGGELRFTAGGDLVDLRGARWSVEGAHETLDLQLSDGRVWSDTYPDPLARLWSALQCPRAGDVLVSAGPGYEFVDWGGAHHVGGGSHGALHRGDSLGVLILCGTGPGAASERVQWTVRDAVPVISDHFGIQRPATPGG